MTWTAQLPLFGRLDALEVVPWPEGVAVAAVIDGVPYLEDLGPVDGWVVKGWYYGYPACCVRWFVQTGDDWLDRPGALGRRTGFGHHPVSGHLLCPACAAGEPAPLPDRPAARYGWISWHPEDDAPELDAPSDYSGPGP